MNPLNQHSSRVVIIGSGNVGATTAYALLLDGTVSEIVLVDLNRERAEGEAMDLDHAVPYTNSARVWAGDYRDCAGADIVIIAGGTNQRPGETRLDLLKRNASIFQSIVPQIMEHTRDAILLIATNPVDILTFVTQKVSGLGPERVIGSGTILDTARFRYLLSQYFGVDPRSIHAFIIGEHGDSQVATWSLANVAGMHLEDFCRLNPCVLDQETRDEIALNTKRAAYEIIKRKGATYYAVAAGLRRIVEAILRDQNSVLSVSSLVQGAYGITDVCLSLPTVVNRMGIQRVLQLPLNAEEERGLIASAKVIQDAIHSLAL